jgi:uncharacterized membrane protein YdjX (TVP38/TMEM64 family)
MPGRDLISRLAASRGVRLIVTFLLAGWLLVWGVDRLGGPVAVRDLLGPSAPLFLIPIHAVVAVSPFPSEVLAVGFTPMYGFWGGAALGWTGWFVAAFLQYYVARRTARDFDFEHARSRLPRWLAALPADHPAFLIIARWLPWGPHLVNSAAGVYGVPLSRHAWCAALSIIPHALFVSAVGEGLFGA